MPGLGPGIHVTHPLTLRSVTVQVGNSRLEQHASRRAPLHILRDGASRLLRMELSKSYGRLLSRIL